jgi:hypothetical protein
MRPRSIRARLTTSYLLLVSVCLVLAATYVTWRLQAQYTNTYRRVILTQSTLIGRMLDWYAHEGLPPGGIDRTRVAGGRRVCHDHRASGSR